MLTTRDQEVAKFQARKHITFLFKWFLSLLEDIKREHSINFDKLRDGLPDNLMLIDMADYLDEERFKLLRKRVLDHGNETIRNLERDLENS